MKYEEVIEGRKCLFLMDSNEINYGTVKKKKDGKCIVVNSDENKQYIVSSDKIIQI